jgi:ADP-heptose:LPS heptosyltransferase
MNIENLQRFGLMRPYVSGQANLYPPKRIKRLRELMDTKSPNICVLRGEGMGDVLMTTPTIETLKETFPESAHITYATNTRYLDGGLVKVLQYNPSIDEIIDREQVDEGNYDLVINLHCPCISYERKENPPINRIDLFAAHAGVKPENKIPKYYLQTEEIQKAQLFLSERRINPSDKLIMVHIFTTTTRRNLDNRIFKDALTQLANKGYKLLILSHPTDYSTNVVFSNIPNSIVVSEDIRMIAALMSNCNLVLCPDSAILHLAGALSVPTVSIFGHTDPHARINYYQNAVALWPGGEYMCSPCWSQSCTMKEACYKAITTEMIVSACENKLGSATNLIITSPKNTIQVERI